MTEQIIQFITLEESRRINILRESFELREDRPAIWLQKICCFIMKKLGAFSSIETVKLETHIIDRKRFIEELFHQKKQLLEFFNEPGDTLLIGAEDYAELMNDTASSYPFMFNSTYHRRDKFFGERIFDLKVRVIPWMKGILVIPSRMHCFDN